MKQKEASAAEIQWWSDHIRDVVITIYAEISRHITPNASRKYPDVAKNRIRQELKNDTIRSCWAANLHLKRGHNLDLTQPLILDYLVARGSRRQVMDDDNLKAGFKHIQDGIAHVLKIDDASMETGKLVQVKSTEGRPFIAVAIREGER